MATTFIKRSPVVVNPLYPQDNRTKLDGLWKFKLDRMDNGVLEKWYLCPEIFFESIKVPGCWQGQGFGDNSTEYHKEFGIPIKAFQATYEGTGWYAKEFSFKKSSQDERVWLNFGGINPTAEIWLNGVFLGENHSPLAPFSFEVSSVIKAENFLAIRVSETDRLLGLTYYYCGKWSGIYRDVEITTTGHGYIDQLSILPDAETGKVTCKAALCDIGNLDQPELRIGVYSAEGVLVVSSVFAAGEGLLEYEVQVDNNKLWSPEDPYLYRVNVTLESKGSISDSQSERIGFVELGSEGKHFLINKQPYYMRGTGDFHENPITGSPDTDRDNWRKRLQALKDYGYLYVRCQTFVPVPEYFDAADEVGLLIQSEMGVLGPIGGFSQWHTYNQWPKPTPEFRERYREQWNLIVDRDVCHPSANIYCMSNELSLANGSIILPDMAWRCYHETKLRKPTALIIWTDGGYHKDMPGDFVNDDPKMNDKTEKPLIVHEYRWWSSFPDVSIAHKFVGALRPFAAEIAIEAALKHGMSHLLYQAAKNSQKLQAIEARVKLEKMRRDHPDLAGICHFNAMDTGMSPQGIIDMFYEKKVTTPEEWNQVMGDTVIMSSLNFDNRVYIGGQQATWSLYVSDFSHPPMGNPALTWVLEADGKTIAEGGIDYQHKSYCTCKAGEVVVSLPTITRPLCLHLKAQLTEAGRSFNNSWELWAFPQAGSLPGWVCNEGEKFTKEKKVVVTKKLTEELVGFMNDGGSVVLRGSEGIVMPFLTTLGLAEGRYFFTKPANFPPLDELQDGTIIRDHAIFGDFPHQDFAGLQFYNMIAESPAIDLEHLDLHDEDPIMRMIHSYYASRPLGILLEKAVGKGRLVITSLDFKPEAPESMYLLKQICHYLASDEKEDCLMIKETALRKLIEGTNFTNL